MIEVRNVMRKTILTVAGLLTRERCDEIMRKFVYFVYIVSVIILVLSMTACTNNSKKEAATEEYLDELDVHVLADHKNKELDEYYTELYENLKHTVKENPNMGEEDNFTIQTYRKFQNYQGPFYVFLGINRNKEAIQNVSFELTLGDDADYSIWDDKTIFLTKEEVGTIPTNSVFPILVPITKETLNKTKKIDFNHLNMEINGLYYETANR